MTFRQVPDDQDIPGPAEGADGYGEWTDAAGVRHSYKCGLNPDPSAIKHMVNYCTCSSAQRD